MSDYTMQFLETDALYHLAPSVVRPLVHQGTFRSGLNPFARARDPTLRARVERNVHRRAVALAHHVQSAPIGSLLPRNLRFARGEGIADFVGNLLRKRRIRVNRPAAEIERVDIPSEAREAGFRKG